MSVWLNCNDVYVTQIALITEGDKRQIHPLLHSFKNCVLCMYTCVSGVCYLCYHPHRTAPCHHPRLSGTSQETLRIRGISCVTQGQMLSNKWQCQDEHEYKISWQSIQVVDGCHFGPMWVCFFEQVVVL